MPLANHVPQTPARPGRMIDYDRGVVIRKAQSLGIEIFMYKDEPGVFYSAAGRPVATALAARAGYDTESLLKLRRHRELMAVAAKRIADETGVERPSHSGTVIREIDGYKVVRLGGGRHVVTGPGGELLTEGVALDEATALAVLKDVAEVAAVPVDDGDLGRLGAAGRPDVARPAKEINPAPKRPATGAPPPKDPNRIA